MPPHLTVELLLVENGGKEEARTIVASFRHERIAARYIFVASPGKSNALNHAVRQASGKVILFTDDDIRVPRNWIPAMCEPLLKGEGDVTVGGCRLAPHLERKWLTNAHRGLLASTEYLDVNKPSEFAGVNIACLRTVFDLVPEFDCELGGGGLGNCEDVLFARQLKQAGVTFISRTFIHIEHHPAQARLHYKSWRSAARAYGRSNAYLLYHWYHQFIPFPRLQLFYYQIKLLLRSFINRNPSDADEGMRPWELSYRISISQYRQLIAERTRPHNYEKCGLRKLRVEDSHK